MYMDIHTYVPCIYIHGIYMYLTIVIVSSIHYHKWRVKPGLGDGWILTFVVSALALECRALIKL